MLNINREDAIALIFEFCSSKAKKQKANKMKGSTQMRNQSKE